MSPRRLTLAKTLTPRVRLAVFHEMLRQAGIQQPVPEYRFDLTRRWRMDFAWPEHRVGLEVDGGVWTRGRHTRGSGWVKDTEKLNEAAARGWRLLRTTPDDLCSPATLRVLTLALAADARP